MTYQKKEPSQSGRTNTNSKHLRESNSKLGHFKNKEFSLQKKHIDKTQFGKTSLQNINEKFEGYSDGSPLFTEKQHQNFSSHAISTFSVNKDREIKNKTGKISKKPSKELKGDKRESY